MPNSSLGHKEIKKTSCSYSRDTYRVSWPNQTCCFAATRCCRHGFHTSIRPESQRNHSFASENYSSRRKRIRIACRHRCVESVTEWHVPEMRSERRTRRRQFPIIGKCSDGVFRPDALLGASEAVTPSKMSDSQVANRVRLSHLFMEFRLRKNILTNEKRILCSLKTFPDLFMSS